MLSHIKTIDVASPHTLRLIYDDGERHDVDFQPAMDKGGVFSALANPDVFHQVSLSDDGR